jgi:hypothetical protein
MNKSTILERLEDMRIEYKRQYDKIDLTDCDHDHTFYWKWAGEKNEFRKQAQAIKEAKRLVEMISIIDC